MGLSALRRVLISLFIAHLSVALISEEGREYCTGKGSICEAYNKVDRKCRDETGPKYYDCTCKSGWVPLQKACYDCRSVMGEFMFDTDERNRASCKEDGYKVAPIPSSIISQQKGYNKTAKVPIMSATDSSTDSATETNSAYATLSHEPYTMTLYGQSASVTLPDISVRTEQNEDKENVAGGRGNGGLITSVCVIVLAMLIT
ncbi:hypothetical protein FOCG_17360 [Fusarium oxysporum f. sp. radicis-lycopersici 26381]|uniref:Uncharacterized protein n=1 Tax=Fusarium oxysporum Fo47 TaxID=660027 RepID=W9K2X1_FUSOX|nr:uncharacterized protein FOBCDRAFT_206826 [Fusarium oxysporum Fo47]EWZ36290.1 hypothetical protein FOZG_12022 [Fusarium oxysporum Fo47]EXL40106.1 hypothetical protein FOCG_17360 [Fusarium oxysporum f. sp. radicis-lycopersici 26381]QKD60121.1 hypothetical protein FOBCDRAFT_206826 [Fusarium oxysporum Fo47]